MNHIKTIIAAGCLLLDGCQTVSPEGAQMGVRVEDANSPTARIMYDQVVIIGQSPAPVWLHKPRKERRLRLRMGFQKRECHSRELEWKCPTWLAWGPFSEK